MVQDDQGEHPDLLIDLYRQPSTKPAGIDMTWVIIIIIAIIIIVIVRLVVYLRNTRLLLKKVTIKKTQ